METDLMPHRKQIPSSCLALKAGCATHLAWPNILSEVTEVSLRDGPGYFSYAAETILSVLSLDFLDSNRHNCYLFVGKDIMT